MERYLLFESGCSVCAKLASAIETECGGWLLAHSLRDPSMQAHLDRARPGWRWEPTLLEIDGERLRAFTGPAMAARLAAGVGPRRAFRVARLIPKADASPIGVALGRRQLFQQAGALLGGLALSGLQKPQRWPGEPETGRPHAEMPMGGEEYAGFLLLPERTPVPPFVRPSRLGIPIVCGVGVGRGGANPTAVTRFVSTAADLAREGRFPVYTLSKLPKDLRSVGGYLMKHGSGEVFGGSVDFQSYDSKTDKWKGTVNLWAQVDFPRPFPLWSSSPVEPGGPAVVLEKVGFLPVPGIRVATQAGYVFHWIQKDVLYTLRLEHGPSNQEAQALVASLEYIE